MGPRVPEGHSDPWEAECLGSVGPPAFSRRLLFSLHGCGLANGIGNLSEPTVCVASNEKMGSVEGLSRPSCAKPPAELQLASRGVVAHTHTQGPLARRAAD